MSLKSIKAAIGAIERKKVKLAALRDEIRELEYEIGSLFADVDEAVDHLQEASDALSRLV